MNNYHIKQGLMATNDAHAILATVDLIIFDVDGVLVDASQSYPSAIRDAVVLYYSLFNRNNSMNCSISVEDVSLFKQAGGFNDEWHLAYALCLWVIWHNIDTDCLSLQAFVEQLSQHGGGVQAAEDIVKQAAGSYWDVIHTVCQRGIIESMAKELYGGEDSCEQLFGFSPHYFKKPGYHHLERDLINPSHLSRWHGRVGIYTGRNEPETQFVLRRSGLAQFFSSENCLTTDSGYIKPDPEGIRFILDHGQYESALFIGDTLDDLRTVDGYRTRYPHAAPLYFAGITQGAMGPHSERIFAQHQADFIAPDAATLITALNGLTRLASE